MIYKILLRLVEEMVKDGDLILSNNVNIPKFVQNLLSTSAQVELGTGVANWLSEELLKRDDVEELFLSEKEIQKKIRNLEF